MCYSKEVQLITSLIILGSALFYYLYYSRKFKGSKKTWLLPFLNSSMLVFLCIGLHQFFEFLTLVTDNIIIYKTGLIFSISSVYFLLRSLEVLSNKKLYSRITIIPIVIVSLHILISKMNYAAASFYVRHNSVFFWASAILLFFIYWHVCAFQIYSEIKDNASKKTLLIYLFAITDVSFILSAIYVIFGYFFFSVNVCTDSPSIWCTFLVIQSFLIPILFFNLINAFNRPGKPQKISVKQTIIYLAVSLLILICLILTLPFFKCLTWKFVFP
jgi:hypothetical protein